MKDKSFGIVPILYQKEQIYFLLIQHKAGHWGFPKGHAQSNESEITAACREFEEETGISNYDLLHSNAFVEQYSFVKNKQKIDKTVIYFLALVKSSTVIYQKKEIQDYAWLSYEDTLKKLTHEQSKQLLIEVNNYLQKLFK